MDLSPETIEGLQIAGDSAYIHDQLFATVVEQTCNTLLVSDKRNCILDDVTLSSIDRASIKQAHAGLAVLLLEAAKCDTDVAVISHVLEECKFGADRISEFNAMYNEHKDNLRILLSNTGNNPPHIVDVDWRLDYYIKNNHLEKVNTPTYLISLKTEECGKSQDGEVQFACSQEQLQDLVAKLKDACKSMERASQM